MNEEKKTLLQAFVVAFMDNTRDEMVEVLTRWKNHGRILATVSPVEVLESIFVRHHSVFNSTSLGTALYIILPAMIGKYLAEIIQKDIEVLVGKLIDEVDGVA
jgi:hypothetical protein